MIAIIDYGMGNLRSVLKAFQHFGADACLTRSPAQILDADGVVLPGVGFERSRDGRRVDCDIPLCAGGGM